MVTAWTGAAKRDLQQIYQRLLANDSTTAKATIEAILAGTDNLHQDYQAGKPESLLSGEKVPYKFITVGYYKVLYTFDAEKVSIRTIFHVRQMAEQNQALIAQLDVKAAEVAAKAAEEAAKIAAEQPTPEPVVEPTVDATVETTIETPVVDPVVSETTTTIETADTTSTETPATTTETPSTQASDSDMEALMAKMKSEGVPASDGTSDADMAALEAELLADDEAKKEQEETPEFKDISIDDLGDATKPEGGE